MLLIDFFVVFIGAKVSEKPLIGILAIYLVVFNN